MLFIAPNGGVVFDSRSGRTFTSATPTMKETCLSPLSRAQGVLGDPVPARHTEGVEVNSRRVDLFVNDLRYFRYYGSTHNVLRSKCWG